MPCPISKSWATTWVVARHALENWWTRSQWPTELQMLVVSAWVVHGFHRTHRSVPSCGAPNSLRTYKPHWYPRPIGLVLYPILIWSSRHRSPNKIFLCKCATVVSLRLQHSPTTLPHEPGTGRARGQLRAPVHTYSASTHYTNVSTVIGPIFTTLPAQRMPWPTTHPAYGCYPILNYSRILILTIHRANLGSY